MAQSGGCLDKACISYVWELNNIPIIVHEILHLFGADDCYDNHGKTTCSTKNCIMKWTPANEDLNSSATLCLRNFDKITKSLQEMKTNYLIDYNLQLDERCKLEAFIF